MSWKPASEPPESERLVVGAYLFRGKLDEVRLFFYSGQDWVQLESALELEEMDLEECPISEGPAFWCYPPEQAG